MTLAKDSIDQKYIKAIATTVRMVGDRTDGWIRRLTCLENQKKDIGPYLNIKRAMKKKREVRQTLKQKGKDMNRNIRWRQRWRALACGCPAARYLTRKKK